METITPPTGGWENFGAQIARRQPEAIANLNQIYDELFNQTIQQGCGNCYQKAFYRIQKYLYLQQQNKPLNTTTSIMYTHRKYVLKPGRSLQTSFGGDTLTNDNLTDEAAEKLLQAHPALIQQFERYPSGDAATAGAAKVAAEDKEQEVPVDIPVTDKLLTAKQAARQIPKG